MNSVLLHDSEQSNPHAGRYTVGLTDVYQTLHDRLLEALQKWVPPEEKQNDSALTTSSLQSHHLPNKPIELPVLFPTVNMTDQCLIGSSAVQLDLNNLQLLLAISSQSTSLQQQQQTQSALTVLSNTPSSTVAPKVQDSCEPPSPTNITDNRIVSQNKFYSPLSVCTSGPQYQTPEPLTTRFITSTMQSQRQENSILPSDNCTSESNTKPQSTGNPSNLLHQLLSGADMTQVRTRSELIEPSLCTRLASDTKPELQHSTPNESHATGSFGETEPVASDASPMKQQSVSFNTTIPVSNFQLAHSPMDTTTVVKTNLGTSSDACPIQQSLSGTASSLPSPLSNASNLLVERLLYLLIELQKTQLAGTLGPAPINVSPQTNTSPCSISVEGQGTSTSVNSPVTVPNSSNIDTPNAVNSVRCLRQLSTVNISNSDSDCPSPANWSAPKRSPRSRSPIHGGQNLPPLPWSLSHSGSINKRRNNNKKNTNSDGIYEPRPRSNSDIHNTTRRHLRISRDFRSRSQTKLEQSTSRQPRPMQEQCAESESEGTCELESSLFAQLILSPDSPASSSSRPAMHTKPMCSLSDRGSRNNSGDDHSPTTMTCAPSISSRDLLPSPPKSTKTTPMITPKTSAMRDAVHSPSGSLTCHANNRSQVFEWLRESDQFVAEHCFDIPLGALLATAISPGRNQWAELCCSALFTLNPSVDTVPGITKHVVNKLWHQLLLVALIENNFRPQCVITHPSNREGPLDLAPLSTQLSRSSSHHPQPLRDRVLNAISSLAALDMEESPAPDAYFVAELKRLVIDGARLMLTPALFRLIRYCILAQNAYPYHFSTTYSEAISELEAGITSTPGAPPLTDVLKLLNHLHCFDAGTLKQFFGLSSDPISVTSTAPSQPNSATGLLFPSPPVDSHYWSGGLGNFKRKAAGTDELLLSHRGTIERDPSPIQFRSRAYTTTGCNKSARLSTTVSDMESESPRVSANFSFQSRPRSDTAPSTSHHSRRTERPWRFGIR